MVNKFHIDLIEELQVLMIIFIKKIFLIGYLIYRTYLTLRIFIMREKLDLLCINLVSMLYVDGNEYNLIESDKVRQNSFMNKDEKDA